MWVKIFFSIGFFGWLAPLQASSISYEHVSVIKSVADQGYEGQIVRHRLKGHESLYFKNFKNYTSDGSKIFKFDKILSIEPSDMKKSGGNHHFFLTVGLSKKYCPNPEKPYALSLFTLFHKEYKKKKDTKFLNHLKDEDIKCFAEEPFIVTGDYGATIVAFNDYLSDESELVVLQRNTHLYDYATKFKDLKLHHYSALKEYKGKSQKEILAMHKRTVEHIDIDEITIDKAEMKKEIEGKKESPDSSPIKVTLSDE